MIGSLLIANRGEIACRIIRTARAMGVRSVAVYSDADAGALHARMADEAVHIGRSPAAESYLRGDKLIEAAKASGAEAIHPGYGFLSENPDFAQAVIDSGLIWVGPKPASVRAMGRKDEAKKLMIAAGVPVTPGYLGEDQSDERLAAEAEAIGWPVLVKAVAGGGGKGMRRVEAAAEFPAALAGCRREAASAFGDDRVILEQYIDAPRHVEVQVFGDAHGNIVHLFERDCSLQRRHQKLIEEAPAPGMSEAVREAICAAAVKAARAVDYQGAGTVEFIADASDGLRADRLWFMEMNTRLQVEHPVTEQVTGIDLVEWQLRVASGEKLPKKQEELAINGHAIEARLYAEDPGNGFLPSVGRLEHFDLGPSTSPGTGEGRVEAGVAQGDLVTADYDPLLAKLVAHGADRGEAIGRLAAMLDGCEVWPVRTNAGFLLRAVLDGDFGAGVIDTGFVERKLDALLPAAEPDEARWRGAALVALAPADDEPLAQLDGFRVNSAPVRQVVLGQGGRFRAVSLDERHLAAVSGFRDDQRVVLFDAGQAHAFDLRAGPSAGARSSADGAIVAPMPGRVTAVEVETGDVVTRGQRLLTIEAMKMEHALVAPFDGTLVELSAAVGAQVKEAAVLARVEPVASPA